MKTGDHSKKMLRRLTHITISGRHFSFAVAALATLAIALPVFAHHAWHGYDMREMSTVNGTVTEFDWENPHVWMSFDVPDGKGGVQKWRAGGPSPSRMAGNGWDKDTLKPGDHITAVGNRISDGTYFLRLSKVVLANGKQLLCYGTQYGP